MGGPSKKVWGLSSLPLPLRGTIGRAQPLSHMLSSGIPIRKIRLGFSKKGISIAPDPRLGPTYA
jgi:hypothetical protein